VSSLRPRLNDDSPDLQAARERLLAVCGEVPKRWLLVSEASQSLALVTAEGIERTYGVSTSAAGLDGIEGSFGTPPGVHRITRKIGADQPIGTWFQSREPVGRWPDDGYQNADLILSRILTLEGCEEGLNRGGRCDSLERFIYIHGTNHEDRIGEPDSHGCIRLSNTDVIRLFDQVEEGDPVVIV